MTFNPECNNKPQKQGLFRIYIRITENRRMKRISTNILVPKNSFSVKAKHGFWISSIVPNHKEINSQIVNLLNEYAAINLSIIKQREDYETLKQKYFDALNTLKQRYLFYKDITRNRENTKLASLIEAYNATYLNLIQKYESIEDYLPPSGALAINSVVSEYSNLFNELKSSDDKLIKELDINYNPENLAVFKNFLHHYLNLKEKQNTSLGFLRHIKSKCLMFIEWNGNESLLLNDITRSMINDYLAHLNQKYNSKGIKLKNNTIIDTIQRISMVMNEAVAEKLISSNPVFHINLPEHNKVQRHRLNDSQIEALENLSIDRSDRYLWLAQRMFLFSYYNAGIRIGDCIQLRFRNVVNDRLVYSMSKTTQQKSIKLTAKSLAIISEMRSYHFTEKNDYIFNLLDKTKPYFWAVDVEDRRKLNIEVKKQLMNEQDVSATFIQKALKTLSDMIGNDGVLTFHIARHSFADRARRKMKESNGKITIIDIKNSLGHKKLETTERYLKEFDADSLDVAMEAVFD